VHTKTLLDLEALLYFVFVGLMLGGIVGWLLAPGSIPLYSIVGSVIPMIGAVGLTIYRKHKADPEVQAKVAAEMERERAKQKMREREEAKEREEALARQQRTRAENMMKAGRYEEAAQWYERVGDLEKAGECRRLDRTTYVVSANVHVGKNGGISVDCPHCGGSQPIESKGTSEVTCKYCGRKYIIPKKVLDLL